MEFKKVKLGECVDYILDYRGKTPKKSKTGIPTLSAKSVKNNFIDYDEVYYISRDEYNRFMSKGFPRIGDILMTMEAPLGLVATLDRDDVGLGQRIVTIRGKKDFLDNNYLKFYLQSPKGQHELYSRATGTTVVGISQKNLKNIDIVIPSLENQIRIGRILNNYNIKIEINNKIISNLESQAQAIFKSWFVDFEPFQDGNFVESELGMIPEGWEVKELGEVADFSNGYSFKSKDLLEEKKSKNDYKVFKQADIKVGGGINPNNTKSWIDSEFIRKNKLSRFIIQSGDLMMCMTDMKNNVRLLGNTALVYQPDEYILNQRVGRLRSKQKEIKPSFLYYLTNNSVFLNDLRGRANTGVQVNLSTSEIKRSKVILPTCDIIKRFCDYSESITKSINSLNNQNTKLAELRDALLPKLMAGEIDVSNIKIEGEEVKNE